MVYVILVIKKLSDLHPLGQLELKQKGTTFHLRVNMQWICKPPLRFRYECYCWAEYMKSSVYKNNIYCHDILTILNQNLSCSLYECLRKKPKHPVAWKSNVGFLQYSLMLDMITRIQKMVSSLPFLICLAATELQGRWSFEYDDANRITTKGMQL